MRTEYVLENGNIKLRLISENDFDNSFIDHVTDNPEKVKVKYQGVSEIDHHKPKKMMDIGINDQYIEAYKKEYEKQLKFIETIKSLDPKTQEELKKAMEILKESIKESEK